MKQALGCMLLALAALVGCASSPQPAPPAAMIDTPACAALIGSGDLGVVVERAKGSLQVINTTSRQILGSIDGFGDLSHASVVYGRDGATAYVFGRDGALSKVNLLTRKTDARVQQSGNSIGGAISQDGSLVAAQNYQPGGIKVFDAKTLALVADIPAEFAPGKLSRVVGLADLPGKRFIYSLFDAGEIWIADLSLPGAPKLTKFKDVGRQPYDALLTPNGRHYIAGLFGEDGLGVIDLWATEPKVTRILGGYGRGQEPLPVFKMPHLRGWAVAGRFAYLPAIGRHEVLVVDTESWSEVARIPVAGQPVFVIARPDGRQVWVNFAVPDYNRVQVIDTQSRQIVKTLEPGRAVLHMEFTPRGEAVWISSRDDNRVSVIATDSFETQAVLSIDAPSGIFFSSRANRMGF
ncbi:protein nirF [Paucibacter sp. TC2R-5]|uniref:cytochrome D1 domain-containing protein n=1 Tax=Paucibacter sp. TC2R-5 TaxID=2893555 RepID=UPI0021E3F2BB|nr:cytochrome D1 domain-containing protein [Paucibacter sp. TC2R-5]MCV2358857.1 protein nirF [Paucibacter sp. TC2R-5]